jgi:hypothetical protein
MALYETIDNYEDFLSGLEANRLRKAQEDAERERKRIESSNKSNNGGLGGLLSSLTKDIGAALNTAGTTVSAALSPIFQDYTKRATDNTINQSKQAQEDIAKKYGYASLDEAYDKGDGPEEMWKELQDTTKKAQQQVSKIGEDYKNNAVVKKVNDTKQSQYGADALRTEVNLFRALAPGLAANPVAGAATGALEGVADSIENADGTLLDLESRMSGDKIRNTENATIDAGDMLKRAAIGGVAGAASAGVGGKIGNATSGVGSKLLNNKVITSGIGRGATGGAVSGGISGGLGALFEGGDVIGSTLQGAGSGALTGGIAGGISSGAQKAKTALTDNLGITDTLAAARQKLSYTPEQKPANTDIEPTTANTRKPLEAETTGTAAGEKDFASRTTKDNVAEALKRTGRYLEGMQASLNKSDKKAIGVKDTGKFIDGVRRKTGLDNVSEQAEFSKYITGGENSILDTAQRNALAYDKNGKPFYADTSDIYNGIPKIMKDSKVTASSIGGGNSKEKFIAELQNDIRDYDGDLLGLANSWHDTAATFRKSQAAGAKQKAKVYETLARQVENASYKKIPQENVDAMFEVSSTRLRELANSATNPKVKKAALQAADSLDNTPHTIEDFRHFKEDFVKVNKINDKVLENENGGAVRQARTFRGTLNAVKDALIEKPAYWAANKVGVGLANAGEAVTNAPRATKQTTGRTISTRPISADMQNLYTILGTRIGENEGKDARANATKQRELSSLEEQLAANIADAQNYYEPLIQAERQTQMSPIEYQLADIENGMNLALAAGDLQSYNQLANLYKTAYSIYQTQAKAAQGTGTGTTKLTDAQQKANAAADILNQLESMNPDFGYTVRDIPLLNVINLGGNQYASTADSLASQLGYMLSGATVKDDELQKIKDEYVPQPWDSEATRKDKLTRARRVIAQYQNNLAQA